MACGPCRLPQLGSGENARITALHGAQVLLAPHQTGGTDSRRPHAMKPVPVEVWRRRQTDPEAIRAQILGPNGRDQH